MRWSEIDTIEMIVDRVFGPLGKPKVVTNETGGIIITKDGQTIFPHCIQHAHDAFSKLIFNQCITSSFRRGDGLLSLIIVLSYLSRELYESLKVSGTGLHSRIRHLRAIEAIRTTERNRDHITKVLSRIGIWDQQKDYAKRIRTLCFTTVTPACNAEISGKILTVVADWIGKPSLEDETAAYIGMRVDEATELFDTLVHKSIGTRPSPPSDPVLQFIRENDLMIRGRCREHAAVSQRGASVDGFELLFIKELLGSICNTLEHSIQLDSASDILTARTACTKQLEKLVLFLREEKGPYIIVCGDKVEDEAVHILSNAGIFLIDGTPAQYMEYGVRRCECTLFENIPELMERQDSVSSTPRIAYVERLVLGTNIEVHLLLRGIVFPREPQRKHIPQQLILHGNSAMAVGVYVNMLRRCLKVMRTASHNGGRSGTAEFGDVLVPGAGAGELAWSVLWSQLAAYLSKCSVHELRDRTSGGVPPGLNHATTDQSCDLLLAMEPLVTFLGDAILSHLARTCPAALPECVSLCETISAAYEQVPLALLANARDVLPESLTNGTRAGAGAGARAAGDAGVRNLHRVLMRWRQRLQSAGEGRGRIGLVVTSDLDAEEMCTLEDSCEHGVACSANQFWETFTEVLDLARLQLRVGGQDGVVRVKSCKQRGKLLTASKGRLDRSDSDDSDM